VPTTTTVPASTAPPTTADLAGAFLEALADPSIDPSSVAVGAAALYVEHRRRSGAVLGRPAEIAATVTPGSGRVCTDGVCVVVDAQVVDPATGLVADVAVDGLAVGGRISGNGPLDATDGVGVRVLTAYVTGEGRLVVTLEADNAADVDVEMFPFAAVFRPGGAGAGIETSGSFGPTLIGAGGSAVILLVFDTTELVGRIGLRGLLADGLDVAFDVEIPAPPD
jgi:hypothetical protein